MPKPQAIWLFAGGAMQQLISQKIVERGYKLIITDRDQHCICARYADEIVALDTFDVPGNLLAADNLMIKYDIHAVLTASADCHETVAHVGKKLGVHVIDPAIAHICRHKHLTREVLTKAGIPQPRFQAVANTDEAREFLLELKTPAVLKATNNSGSRGFAVVNTADELTPGVFQSALNAGTTGKVIIEEMLIPIENGIAEQSVETLWYDGKMYWLNWVDRLFRKDFLLFKSLKNTDIYANIPWGIELGHINPAIHSFETKKQVLNMIHDAGVTLGMSTTHGGHILKADTMLTKNGPYILEMTPRLSGGWDSCGTTPARSADFVGGVIALALNERLDLELWHRYFEYQDPQRFSAVLAAIPDGARDCIGREFTQGEGYDRESAIQNALNKLLTATYVSASSN